MIPPAVLDHTPEDVPVAVRFRAAIRGIAIKEMGHLALVANLTCAGPSMFQAAVS